MRRGGHCRQQFGERTFLEVKHDGYVSRLKSNGLLEREIEHLLKRPAGRRPEKPIVRYHEFMYQAASWDKARRVVAKVEWHRDELFPRVGFLVTNLGGGAAPVTWFYNDRGTAEQWIKEGKNAVRWTKLPGHDFADNQVRLQLFALAYNRGNFLRRLALPAGVKQWSLTTLREKLLKIGAKVVHHARSVVFQMAEVAVLRELFRLILAKIRRLRLPMAVSG
ncbi:MAG: transposase [Tepidisphaeraceae bacterium]